MTDKNLKELEDKVRDSYTVDASLMECTRERSPEYYNATRPLYALAQCILKRDTDKLKRCQQIGINIARERCKDDLENYSTTVAFYTVAAAVEIELSEKK